MYLCVISVCLQIPVEGFIGDSVVLPCSSAEHDLKLQDINVLWRDKDSETIYDLIKGKASVERQDPRYKNRAETFPEEYKRGNFSLKLQNLTHTDEGEFSCFITHTDELRINVQYALLIRSSEYELIETKHVICKVTLVLS
uniref:Ig-like domain-containing protein n=1 Tax=Sinocyclocheilus grahami TaxID=75366 RepID=A0A672TCA1_SINGR